MAGRGLGGGGVECGGTLTTAKKHGRLYLLLLFYICIILLIYVDHALYWRNTILALLFQVISEDWEARDRALDGRGKGGTTLQKVDILVYYTVRIDREVTLHCTLHKTKI